MKFIATQKFLRISPSKVRPVVGMVKKMNPVEAVEVLPNINKRPAIPLAKVITTAIANAKQKGVDPESLKFLEIQIGEGPRIKKGRPVSRGRMYLYNKRMSHIRIVLTEKPIVKNDQKTKKKKVKLVAKDEKIKVKKGVK